MIAFERIRPVINPFCSNIRRANGYLNELYDDYPSYRDPAAPPIETSPYIEQTIERVRRGTRPGDLVPVLGGDSTVGAVAQAIAGREITMLTLWAGNGNDGSRDLNGKVGKRPIRELIEHGTTAEVHPLDIAIDSLKQLQAINYFEVGANARDARLLNNRRWRHLPGYGNNAIRMAYECIGIPPVTVFSRRFPITEEGESRMVLNFTVANSHTMAKFAQLPTRLREPRIFMTEYASHADLLPWAARAVTGRLTGEYLDKGQSRSLTIGRTVLFHADAEPDVVEQGSTITLSIAETPFWAVSSRP